MPLLTCPNCDAAMQAVQRVSVEFDMCPQCRGVWLDRGELEKLMTIARDEVTPPPVHPRLPNYDRPRLARRAPERPHDGDGRDEGPERRRFDLVDVFD